MAVQLPPKRNLCGTAEAADLYGCSPQHMWLMAKRGQCWSKRVAAKSILFDADEIARLAKDRDCLRKAGKLGGRRPGQRKTA